MVKVHGNVMMAMMTKVNICNIRYTDMIYGMLVCWYLQVCAGMLSSVSGEMDWARLDQVGPHLSHTPHLLCAGLGLGLPANIYKEHNNNNLEIETDRQTDRQRDRETDRQTERQTEK